MTKSYSQDNLFTTFNNIEKIKKSKQERKLKKMIRLEEMIKTIKEHYNLNSSMLADNLGVGAQTVYKWEKGESKPNMKPYNKIKELYEEIVKEDKAEVLEQPEITVREIGADVTAGTPFIEVTSDFDDKKVYLNVYKIREVVAIDDATHVYTTCNTIVKETPAEVLEFIRKKIKENEKN